MARQADCCLPHPHLVVAMTLLRDTTGPIDLLDPARVSARAAAVRARITRHRRQHGHPDVNSATAP